MIEIPIMMKNNPGIMGLKMTLTYDEKILTPVSAKASELLKGNFDDNIGNKDGQYSVLWSGTENVYGNGEIFVATF